MKRSRPRGLLRPIASLPSDISILVNPINIKSTNIFWQRSVLNIHLFEQIIRVQDLEKLVTQGESHNSMRMTEKEGFSRIKKTTILK